MAEKLLLNQIVPFGIGILSKIMPNVSEFTLKDVIGVVFQVVQKKYVSPKTLDMIRSKNVDGDFDQLLSGILMLLQNILRLKPDVLKEQDLRECLKALKFSDQCCDQFVNEFFEHKNLLYKSCHNSFPYFLSLETVNWRIVVSVSSSYLKKNVDTLIIISFIFTNGTSRSFEMSVAKFYQLRFYVSSMLSEMLMLKQKSFFK